MSYRIRHIKCDEGRPVCLKCQDTGRTCDGYLSDTKRRTALNNKALFTTPVIERKPFMRSHRSLIPAPLNLAVTGTTPERQCFEYFCLQIGQELSTALQSEPTYQFVLQACYADDAVKAAVIAIGSMGQRLRIDQVLTSNNQEANAFQRFAQVQYCKAIELLRARIVNEAQPRVELALISCYLFVILGFLQGNEADSLVHLRSGLKILRRENGFKGAMNPLRREITRIFSVMDMEATHWLGLESFQSTIIMPLDGPVSDPPSLITFSNFDDAAIALIFQITRLSHFQRWITAYDTTLHSIPQDAYKRHQDLLNDLQRWPVGLEILLGEVGDLSHEMRDRVTLMRLNHRITVIQLSTCLNTRDEQGSYEENNVDYRQMLVLAKSVICNLDGLVKPRVRDIFAAIDHSRDSIPLFSFYAGVIRPLYILAISCRDLRLCREAVSWLSVRPWREGAWDSFSMAKIAERKIQQLERQGYYQDK